MSLIKSKQRVADHGEVFTPPWMVQAMLDLVKQETERLCSQGVALGWHRMPLQGGTCKHPTDAHSQNQTRLHSR